jgi:hypothetical protein
MNEIFGNLLNPPILFFFLGILAVLIKSDLDIPQPIPKLLSVYLLLAIGFKGGAELAHSAVGPKMIFTLLTAVAMSFITPLYAFIVLRKKVSIYDAGAIAATYGSISAVTFITASSFLQDLEVAYGGHMVAAMALMESPAIIVGVFLIRKFTKDYGETSYGGIIKEALTNGSVVLLLGSLIIGMLVGEKEVVNMKPFTDYIFKGMLTLFLLDMGLLTGKRMRSLRNAGLYLLGFGVLMPLFNAVLGIGLSLLLQLEPGNALLLTILVASASYIAVPAAMRMSVPEANPGLYVPLSLAVTFSFNIIVGIPLYYQVILWIDKM